MVIFPSYRNWVRSYTHFGGSINQVTSSVFLNSTNNMAQQATYPWQSLESYEYLINIKDLYRSDHSITIWSMTYLGTVFPLPLAIESRTWPLPSPCLSCVDLPLSLLIVITISNLLSQQREPEFIKVLALNCSNVVRKTLFPIPHQMNTSLKNSTYCQSLYQYNF